MALQAARIGLEFVDVLRISDQPRVQHVELDGHWIHVRGAGHREPAGVVVEVDDRGGGQQVASYGWVLGWGPRQTSNSDDELELLGVTAGGDVGGEQCSVQVAD